MRTIFISYRRDDAEGEAGRLFDDLVKQFGESRVFIDVSGIEIGRDFRKAIDESVSNCGVLLAVIGRNWLEAKTASGARRLEDPNDFVRLEIATALKRDIPVVPVLVHGATMPSTDALPADLKDLAFRNNFELTHVRWNSDVQVLAHALQRYVDPVVAPVAEKKRRYGILAGIGVLVLAALLAYRFVAIPAPAAKTVSVQVPSVVGLSLDAASKKLSQGNLVPGNITKEPRSNIARNVVVEEFPAAGRQVDPGTPVDLVVSESQGIIPKPQQPQKQLPNFAGTWQLFESSTNGTAEPVTNQKPTVITQAGDVVNIGRPLTITSQGTVTYQTFSAHDDKYGHQVNSAQEADLIDTFVWSIEGDVLVFRTTFYYQHSYFNHPPGTQVRVMKYRRIAP